jgi:hypothetical protein
VSLTATASRTGACPVVSERRRRRLNKVVTAQVSDTTGAPFLFNCRKLKKQLNRAALPEKLKSGAENVESNALNSCFYCFVYQCFNS